MATTIQDYSFIPQEPTKTGLLTPLRRWMDGIEVNDRRFASFLCQFIPCKCPFEQDIEVFGRKYHTPALCKINPLYEEVVHLRLRALMYLADVCGEDVTRYIC